MQWQILSFADLDTQTLYALLQLRVDIFVVEQHCPYPELDNKDLDPQTRHILLKKGDKVIAYARILAPGVSFPDSPGIGRVCVSQTARHLGLGRSLVEKTLDITHQLWPQSDIHISAQCHLQQFYQSLGFHSASEPYFEDDIPHLKMVLPYQANSL